MRMKYEGVLEIKILKIVVEYFIARITLRKILTFGVR